MAAAVALAGIAAALVAATTEGLGGAASVAASPMADPAGSANLDLCARTLDPCARTLDPPARTLDPPARRLAPCARRLAPPAMPVRDQSGTRMIGRLANRAS
jgi:hypothetical protein